MSVDLSLARGLRSSILRQIVAARRAADKAASLVFSRKATMPSTAKGVRRMHAELARHLDKFALCSSDLSKLDQWLFWHRWALRQNVTMDSWTEDQLSVDMLIFDMYSPQQAYVEIDYPVGFSMHLLERAFLRLDTTRNDLITKELIVPALIACGICYFIFIGLYAF